MLGLHGVFQLQPLPSNLRGDSFQMIRIRLRGKGSELEPRLFLTGQFKGEALALTLTDICVVVKQVVAWPILQQSRIRRGGADR